jgi:hypothetical protein
VQKKQEEVDFLPGKGKLAGMFNPFARSFSGGSMI